MGGVLLGPGRLSQAGMGEDLTLVGTHAGARDECAADQHEGQPESLHGASARIRVSRYARSPW